MSRRFPTHSHHRHTTHTGVPVPTRRRESPLVECVPTAEFEATMCVIWCARQPTGRACTGGAIPGSRRMPSHSSFGRTQEYLCPTGERERERERERPAEKEKIKMA